MSGVYHFSTSSAPPIPTAGGGGVPNFGVSGKHNSSTVGSGGIGVGADSLRGNSQSGGMPGYFPDAFGRQVQQPFGLNQSPSFETAMTFGVSGLQRSAQQPVEQPLFSASSSNLYNMEATIEVPGCDSSNFESIRRTLMALQDIAPFDFDSLINVEDPEGSAARIDEVLCSSSVPADAHESIASRIITPQHLKIIAALSDRCKDAMRDAVLQGVLETITTTTGKPMAASCEMLAAMVQLNLVYVRGVATTIVTLLQSAKTQRAAVAVMGRVAEQSGSNDALVRAMQVVEPMLRGITDPEYEYDVLTIGRLMKWNSALRNTSLVKYRSVQPRVSSSKKAVLSPSNSGDSPNPPSHRVASMAYIPVRDELLTAHSDGSIVAWGGANPATGEVKPASILYMSESCIPVAMDASERGNMLVIAGMPPASSNHTGYASAARRSGSRNSGSAVGLGSGTISLLSALTSGTTNAPVIQLLSCNEQTGSWSECDVIHRADNSVLSAVKALDSQGFGFCVAESRQSDRGDRDAGDAHLGGISMQHDLVLFNAATSQETVRLSRVHTDYVTVLNTLCESENVIISGSRDASVKLWDIRSIRSSNGSQQSNAAAVLGGAAGNSRGGKSGLGGAGAVEEYMATPYESISSIHSGAITSIVSYRNVIVTAALDGNLVAWDPRNMSSPLHKRTFGEPILSVVGVYGGSGGSKIPTMPSLTSVDDSAFASGNCYRVVVSTARALSLVSLESLTSEFIVPNVCYSMLKSNSTGTAVISAGGLADGIDFFTLQN